ncbi:MAG: PspA/IM30 family protein [Dehalococcoidia bacterium]
MGLWKRTLLLFRTKGRAALEKAEDPRQIMGYVDEQQQELLRQVKQGLIEVAISKHQLQRQVSVLEARVPRMENQAKRALAANREDLAKLSLARKQTALAELENLQGQVAEVDQEEQRMILAEQQLSARIEEFRLHRQTLAARYNAAEAQVRVKESLSGVSQDFSELGMALGRAEEKIDRMLARASAVDVLLDNETMITPVRTEDPVERELRTLADQGAVEAELSALREEMVTGAGNSTTQE